VPDVAIRAVGTQSLGDAIAVDDVKFAAADGAMTTARRSCGIEVVMVRPVFGLLAVVMVLTREVDWSSLGRKEEAS
jgi:hypothetical protein